MSATVVKPNAGYRLSRTELRRRWIALADDPLVAAIPFGEKVAAYLTAGAHEVWLVGDDGVPEIRTSGGRVAASELGFELPRVGSR